MLGRGLLDPLLDDLLAVAAEVHLAGGDLAERHHGGFVLSGDERAGAFLDLPGALRREDDEGKPVFLTLEAVFDGDAGHGCSFFPKRAGNPSEPGRDAQACWRLSCSERRF